ncbi:uncharacterized protein JCM6883_006177 [Sporobolomyces salmoneus]|uniref:uncharacterized protein n=1 Tax=Sporobolomyces salmoneus TaxID=183962 RepID=UPI0031702658
MAPLLQFKAGRSFREGQTNQVVSNPDRGLIYLEEEDDLLHFRYKDLSSSSVLEDLIIFPGDAHFAVANKEHRVSVLKFNSSSARHFFWHQDQGLTEQDFEQRTKKVNELIGSEEAEATGAEEGSGMQVEEAAPVASTSSSSAPQASARGGPPPVSGQQALQLENILSAFRAASGNKAGSSSSGGAEMQALQSALRGSGGAPEFTLPDVLPSSALTSLISSLPDSSLSHLSSFLPPSLPSSTPATQRASLIRALTSPEFKRSTSSLDRALRTGATGPVLRSLGMERGEEGVEEFLNEIMKEAEKTKGEETSASEEGKGTGDGETEEKMQE